jgi:predicted ABC-type ATPase
MKKDVRIIFEDTAYRYMPNTSIENDVLDKVRHTIDNNKFTGNFYSSLWQGGGDGYLYELDEHDDYLVRRQNLKEGERIYRYFTRRSAFTGQVPLIKINIDKGLLYFLKDDEGLDLIEFETKGIPVRYLNIIPPQNEEYAEGGETEPQDYHKLNMEFLKIFSEYGFINAVNSGDNHYINEKGDILSWSPKSKTIGKGWLIVRLSKTYPYEMHSEISKIASKIQEEHPDFKINYESESYERWVIKVYLKSYTINDLIKLFNEFNFKKGKRKGNLSFTPYYASGGMMADGGELKSYLSSRSDMFDENAKTINKKEILEVISLSKNSDKKYWVKDLNTKYSYYIYKGNLRANDGTGGIFSTTILNPMWYYLKDEHRFKVQEEALYDWEKESDPSIVKVGWDAIKEKFDKIFYMEQDGNDEIFANEVKLEESTYNWDGRPSPYKARVSFADAKSMFLRSLTPEEAKMIDIEYDYKDVHELFGLMSEKKFIIKRKKDETQDFMNDLENMNFEDNSLYMKNGGTVKWQDVYTGDKALVISENKMGYVIKPYGRRFHLRFPDGTEKTYSAEELEFFKDEEYAEGGMTDKMEGGVKKNMLFDKNGERRVDPEALAYIENTVEMLPQTKFMYTKENGQYTPERKKLHEEILATFHEGKPCINQRPAVAILTGGAPASGKTTFIKKFVDLDPEKVYHVDADEVRAMLPEYKGWNATQTHLETADLVNQLIDDIGVPCDHDLIYDGTMNKATKYEKIVEKLHKLGYKVFVVYISIPEQVSKERVISRYKKAGRYVPMKVIEEVYDNGLKAFEKVAYEMADGYIRIDGMNGEIIEQGGMSMPSNIEYDKGGEIAENKLKNGTALVRSAERYAEAQTGEAVDKGKGMARAFKLDGKMAYNSVIVFFKNGEHIIYDEDEFPKFFMKDGGELGGQDYYDGFQMQVVQKKGNPDKEVQKENIKMNYRKGGKL